VSAVIDASVAIDYLLNPTPPQSLRAAFSQPLYAPSLLDFEVTSAMRGLLLSDQVQLATLRQALGDFATLDIDRVPMTGLLPRLLELSHNFTSYDAAYIVLAQLLDLPLVTSDRKLGEARRLGVDVRVVPAN
jgi:predicted nucleic acid-binding protein